jgi:hypothetical protein
MEQVPPEVLALVIADGVHHDDVAGKLFLLGTRSVIVAKSFPLVHPRLAGYVALVNGRREMLVRVRVIDGDEEREPVATDETVMVFPDPLTEVELVFEFTDLIFPEPGDYRLQLHVPITFCASGECGLFFMMRKLDPNCRNVIP